MSKPKSFGGVIPFFHNGKDQNILDKNNGFQFRLPLTSSSVVRAYGGGEGEVGRLEFESEWKQGPAAWKACAAVDCLINVRADLQRISAKEQGEWFLHNHDYWFKGRFEKEAEGSNTNYHFHPPNSVPRISLKPCLANLSCTVAGTVREEQANARDSSGGNRPMSTADRGMFAHGGPIFECARPTTGEPWGSRCWVAS